MDRSNARTMEFYRRIGIVDRVRALGYPADNPMDVFLTTRLSDPPIAVLRYPSVAERRKQIAQSPDGAWLLEPYQLVSQNKLEPLLKEVAEGTPNVRYATAGNSLISARTTMVCRSSLGPRMDATKCCVAAI
jgi:2-polyprenyl-6-methoxyphenol hydroxylase-like FAD-dependent oxidoreductase